TSSWAPTSSRSTWGPRSADRLAGEEAQVRDRHVDRGRHRRDVAGGLRQEITTLDGRDEPGGELGHVGVRWDDALVLEAPEEIAEEFLPGREEALQLRAREGVLVGDLVRQ